MASYNEQRMAEFKDTAKRATNDYEREQAEARLEHAKRAVAAEKDATPVPDLVVNDPAPEDSGTRPKQRNARQARFEG